MATNGGREVRSGLGLLGPLAVQIRARPNRTDPLRDGIARRSRRQRGSANKSPATGPKTTFAFPFTCHGHDHGPRSGLGFLGPLAVQIRARPNSGSSVPSTSRAAPRSFREHSEWVASGGRILCATASPGVRVDNADPRTSRRPRDRRPRLRSRSRATATITGPIRPWFPRSLGGANPGTTKQRLVGAEHIASRTAELPRTF